MNHKLTTILGGLLALALIATACGGSDDAGNASSEDQALIDAVSAQMQREGDLPEDVDFDCMAAAMVSGLGGAEAMEANYGLTVQSINDGEQPDEVDLPKDQAIELATEAMDCGLGNLILGQMTAEGAMDDEAAECLFGNLDQNVLRDIMATEFMNATDAAEVEAAAQNDLLSSLFDAVAECDIDPSALGL